MRPRLRWLVVCLVLDCRQVEVDSRPPRSSEAPGADPAPLLQADAAGSPAFDVVLEDPRLTGVRDRLSEGDAAGAALRMNEALAGARLRPRGWCAWSYVAGRLDLAAGDTERAIRAFDDVRSSRLEDGAACPLASYAALREAEGLVRLGRYPSALECVRQVDGGLAGQDEARLALADALAGSGDVRAALGIWRSLLAVHPHGLRWVDTANRLAHALLDGVDGSAAAHAEEALGLGVRVLVEAPPAAERLDVGGLCSQAAELLHVRVPPWSADQRVQQARAWLESAEPKRARELAESALRSVRLDDVRQRPAACDAATLLAQTASRSKPEAVADAWGEAIVRCTGDALASALYQGAKASGAAKRREQAVQRFAQVEARFPDHRLADDARLRAALVVDEMGDRARSLAMLSSLSDAYPRGDMRGEALFRVGLDHLEDADLAAAQAAFEAQMAQAPEPAGSAIAGRGAYFSGRVAQLSGDIPLAEARYQDVVEQHPLSYFMLLAYDRLRGLDPALARETLAAAMGREPDGDLVTADRPEFDWPEFDRFERLLEVGEVDAARREVTVAGLTSETVDPEVLWRIASLYDRAGAPEMAQALVRGPLAAYRDHWPSGRWRAAWEIAFPRPWEPVVARESTAAGVPPWLVWAIMREESAFNPDARSGAAALGLMQLIGPTARLVARDTSLGWDEDSLVIPAVSIALGSRLLASLQSTFPGRLALAVAAYNGGQAAVRRWLAARAGDEADLFDERISFDETRTYVKRVLASDAAYVYLYDRAALDDLSP